MRWITKALPVAVVYHGGTVNVYVVDLNQADGIFKVR